MIGTDAPGVDQKRVEQAFDSLDASDVVFGPTSDGGYYLLGLNRPQPELFPRSAVEHEPGLRGELRTSVLRSGSTPRPSLPCRTSDTLEDLEGVGI